MGARTQMVIEAVNIDGSRETRAYHFQWGAGRPMFMVLMNHLTSMCCRDFYDKRLTDVAFPVDLLGYGRDLGEEARESLRMARQSRSKYKRKLNSGDDLSMELIDGETFREAYIRDVNHGTAYMRAIRRQLTEIHFLSMDDMKGVREFLRQQDNNNGAMLVRFRAVKWGRYPSDCEWEIDLMMLHGAEQTGVNVSESDVVSPREYMKRFPLCTEEFMQMAEASLRYWEVNIMK